ncbi:AI-2E family transporter [Paenibacillus eucommiae]|uniref:PurR-regulated permease PerM n=1 Tax=Paenibacillus eucommiae TaxID=1355755 RepID=A0ABS4IR85_9BACL|nr:AI-2E family transporter [Paenibacillus eucommiae]MBP1990050.1 putative PurR-regulated permease PerM [Paenibacillus eucommiae]
MLQQSRFFRICLGIIALLLIVFLTSKVSFLFNPLVTMFNILIVPFMLAGFFYYLLRPIVSFLSRKKINKILAILLIYFLLAAVVVGFLIIVWPPLQKQIENFVDGAPQLIAGFQEQINKLQENRIVSMFTKENSDISSKLSEYLNKGITVASNYIVNLVSVFTNFFIIVASVPIILYYMLKESDRIPTLMLNVTPKRYRHDGKEVIKEIDSALSKFIVGRVVIMSILSVMMYIGYLIIGLPYALLLSVIGFVLNIIPYFGALLGAIPVLIVAFIHSPTMALWALIVITITQQIEGNLISPNIYGKSLDIHPLTTIVLLLIAGEIAGFLGIILAIPAYMIAKIIIVRVYHLFLEEKVEELIE